jgi:hypothetical protein
LQVNKKREKKEKETSKKKYKRTSKEKNMTRIYFNDVVKDSFQIEPNFIPTDDKVSSR